MFFHVIQYVDSSGFGARRLLFDLPSSGWGGCGNGGGCGHGGGRWHGCGRGHSGGWVNSGSCGVRVRWRLGRMRWDGRKEVVHRDCGGEMNAGCPMPGVCS